MKKIILCTLIALSIFAAATACEAKTNLSESPGTQSATGVGSGAQSGDEDLKEGEIPVSPIKPGGNYDGGEEYDGTDLTGGGASQNVVKPIKPSGNYDGGAGY